MTTPAATLTVTLNPAIDETIFLDRLIPGTVHRATGFHRQAAGTGVNVAAMLARAGHPVTVTGLLGQDNARHFESFFRILGIRDRFVRLPGETRRGIKLIDRTSTETTDVNLPGLTPHSANLDELEAVVRSVAEVGSWVVVSGSLPPGVEPRYIGRLVELIRAAGANVAVDTSGDALRVAVDAGVDLIKPNVAELSELVGSELDGFAGALEAASELHRNGIAHVVVSLGHEGALFFAPEMGVMAGAPPVSVVSTVGAGDALLAGYLSGLLEGKPIAERARRASVFAWCALESLERELVPPEELENRAAHISVQPLPAEAKEGS